MTSPVDFDKSIKPYFTVCYRAHMMMFGDQFDLWDADAVKDQFPKIRDQVDKGFMPQAGCPDGVWDAITRKRFLADFDAWQAANFPGVDISKAGP